MNLIEIRGPRDTLIDLVGTPGLTLAIHSTRRASDEPREQWSVKQTGGVWGVTRTEVPESAEDEWVVSALATDEAIGLVEAMNCLVRVMSDDET